MLTVKGVQALTEHAHMLEDNDMIERSINELEMDFSLIQDKDIELEHIAEVAEPYLIHAKDD